MIKSILVPVEASPSETGIKAIHMARDMARAYGGKLVLLHVLEELPGYVAAQLPKDTYANARKGAEDGLKDVAKEHGLGGDTEIVLLDGNPSAEILDYAEKTGAEMIVIASHNPGLQHFFLGSVAARVVRHADCSVMVVRGPGGDDD